MPDSVPSVSWLARIVHLLDETAGARTVLVRHARPSALSTLLRALLPRDPDLVVLTDASRILLPDFKYRLVLYQPDPHDGPWLDTHGDRLLGSGLRLLIWLSSETEAVLQGTSPKFLGALKTQVLCGPEALGPIAAMIREARRAPGVDWRGGSIDNLLRLAMPNHTLHWVSAAADYSDIVGMARDAGRNWLGIINIDGPFRLRRVRWALAEARRTARNLIVDSRVPSPGWWPVQERRRVLREATSMLAQAGARYPGRLAAISGLEDDMISLLVKGLKTGIPEDTLMDAMLLHRDPARGLSDLALHAGVFSIVPVARGQVDPAVFRALWNDPRVRASVASLASSIRRRLLANEELEPDEAAWWAASTDERVPTELLERTTTSVQAWLVEAALRHGLDTGEEWRVLADAANRLGDPQVAAHWADIALKMPTTDSLARARAMYTRGRVCYREGDFTRAESLFLSVLKVREAELEPDAPALSATLHALGQSLSRQGRYPEALKAFMRALSMERRSLGESYPDTAITLEAIGRTMAKLNRLHEACSAFEQVLRIKENTLGPDHPSTAATWHAIGQLFVKQQEFDSALNAFDRDLAITQRVLGPDHPSTASTLHALGRVLLLQKRYAKALDYFQRELAILEHIHEPDHAEVTMALDAMGETLLQLGRPLEALDAFQFALNGKKQRLGDTHSEVAASLHSVAGAMARQGDLDHAIGTYRKAVAMRETTLGPDHVSTAFSLHALAQLLVRKRKYVDAIPIFERALAIKEATLGKTDIETAITEFELGRAMRDSGDPRGLGRMEAAAAMLERRLGHQHPTVAAAHKALS